MNAKWQYTENQRVDDENFLIFSPTISNFFSTDLQLQRFSRIPSQCSKQHASFSIIFYNSASYCYLSLLLNKHEPLIEFNISCLITSVRLHPLELLIDKRHPSFRVAFLRVLRLAIFFLELSRRVFSRLYFLLLELIKKPEALDVSNSSLISVNSLILSFLLFLVVRLCSCISDGMFCLEI